MVQFLKCATLCNEENSEDNLDNLIKELNEKFGDKSCACHPDKVWKIGVDVMEDCKYHFHDTWEKNPPCTFDDRLIKNEILPYIKQG